MSPSLSLVSKTERKAVINVIHDIWYFGMMGFLKRVSLWNVDIFLNKYGHTFWLWYFIDSGICILWPEIRLIYE